MKSLQIEIMFCVVGGKKIKILFENFHLFVLLWFARGGGE